MTCIIGWVFIGQVIGQINLLMLALDKDAKEQQELVEDFEQYAKQRSLPHHLRLRAMDSMAYKSECFFELTVGSNFATLPNALQIHLYTELYGSYLEALPEFSLLTRAQLEAIANALYLEIYLHGDTIYESGRIGARLFIMKQGCAELYGPHSKAVYAVINSGDIFGEFAFFLPGARRVASARAVKSCQILQLDRRKWNALWPQHVRLQIEKSLLPLIKHRYKQTTRAYMNIAKNVYIKNDITAVAPSRVGTVVVSNSERSLNSRRASLVMVGPVSTNQSRKASKHPSLAKQSSASDSVSSRKFSLPKRPTFRRSMSLTPVMPFSAVKAKLPPKNWIEKRQVSFPPTRRQSLQDVMELESLSDSAKERSVAPSEPFRGLSAQSESQWGRHFKRLQALQIFHADWARVEKSVQEQSEETNSYRRWSVSVLPSYYDNRTSGKPSASKNRRSLARRRHTIQLNPRDLQRIILEQHNIQRRISDNMAKVNTVDVAKITSAMVAPSGRGRSSSFNSNDSRGVRATNSRRTGKVAPFQAPVYHSVVVIPAPVSPMFLVNSDFRYYWDAVMLFVTLFYVVVMPFRASFLLHLFDDERQYLGYALAFAAEYVMTDLVCIVDFVLKRNYFVIQKDGETIADSASITKHYWVFGSYLVDVLSMFPTEILIYLAYCVDPHRVTRVMDPNAAPSMPDGSSHTVWHILALGRLNRFLRGIHLHALLSNVRRFVMYDLKLEWLKPSHFDILRLAIDFALGIHWIACFFYGVSFMTYVENEPSWLTHPGMLLFQGASSFAEVAAIPRGIAYVRSLHFSIGAITTVCYGDILPMNATETLVTLIVIVLSVALFSMLSGGFFKFFEHEFGKRADYEEKVSQVGSYMVFHQFPSRTWKQMQVYFALSWQESKGMQESQMLRGVTVGVRQDIALHVHANLMKHVKLFTFCDERFAKVIIAALTHELFVRNDVVVQRGDKGRSLYIIESGLVSVSVMRTVPSDPEPSAASVATVAAAAAEPLPPVAPIVPPKRPSIAKRAVRKKTGTGSMLPPASRVRLAVMAASTVAYQVQTTEISQNKRKEAATKQVEEKYVKGPYEYFGERSLLFATPQHATCVSLCVCSLFVLSSARFEDILEEFPTYRRRTMRAWVMNLQKDEAKGL